MVIKLAICGVCGKMGKRIAILASRDKDFSIEGATEVKGCSLIGVNLGKELKTDNLGAIITDDLAEIIQKCDVVIDFTAPLATMANIKAAVKFKKPIVVGTTGLTEDQVESVKDAAKSIPVLFSPNMSFGVNVVFDIISKTAASLGSSYQVKIEEVHHIQKKDKPSGTAKMIGAIIKDARKDIADVDIESIREGEVVGDHKVIFESASDIIEVSHRAKSRDIFADGALRAAKFLVGKPKGLYSMKDILGGV